MIPTIPMIPEWSSIRKAPIKGVLLKVSYLINIICNVRILHRSDQKSLLINGVDISQKKLIANGRTWAWKKIFSVFIIFEKSEKNVFERAIWTDSHAISLFFLLFITG